MLCTYVVIEGVEDSWASAGHVCLVEGLQYKQFITGHLCLS